MLLCSTFIERKGECEGGWEGGSLFNVHQMINVSRLGGGGQKSKTVKFPNVQKNTK